MVLILDASTSVKEENFLKMLQFTKDVLKDADIDSGIMFAMLPSINCGADIDSGTMFAMFSSINCG